MTLSESTPLVSTSAESRDPRDPDELLEDAVTDAYITYMDDEEDEDTEDDDEILWIREQREQNKQLPWTKRPSVWMVGLGLFLTALASSSAEPSRTAITFKLACNTLSQYSDKPGVCDPTESQILISNLTLVVQISAGIVTMIASGKVGQLSDQYGRKVFIAIIIACILLGRTIQFFSLEHSKTLPFYTILFSDLIAALGGGVVTLVALTNSYISDVVESHERIYSLGLSIASLYIGLSLGPMIGNLLLAIPKRFGNHVPDADINSVAEGVNALAEGAHKIANSIKGVPSTDFIPLKFEIGLLSVVLIYCIFIIPESRSERARTKSRSMSRASTSDLAQFSQSQDARAESNEESVADDIVARTNCKETMLARLFNLFNFLKPLRLLTLPVESVSPSRRYRISEDRLTVFILALVDCLHMSIATAISNIMILYGVYKFQWTSTDLGHFMAVACSSRATVLIVISPMISHTLFHKKLQFKIFKRQFDMVDYSMATLGLFAEFIGFVFLYFANSSSAFFLVLVIQSIGTITSPSINSAIIKHFPESKIGEYFGATSILKNGLALLSPLIFLTMYKVSLSKWHRPELLFALLAVIAFVFLVLLVVLKRMIHLTPETKEDVLLRSQSLSNSRRPSFSSEYSRGSRDSMDISSLESDGDLSGYNSPIPGNSRGLSREIERSNSFCRN